MCAGAAVNGVPRVPLSPSDLSKDHLNTDKRKQERAPGGQTWGPSGEDEDGRAGPAGKVPPPLCPFHLCALGQIT